jgi:hypothetical protein
MGHHGALTARFALSSCWAGCTGVKQSIDRRRTMIEHSSKRLVRAALVTVCLASLGACSAQQAYYGGQAWQRNECVNVVDTDEREQCIAATRLSYRAYRSLPPSPADDTDPSH